MVIGLDLLTGFACGIEFGVGVGFGFEFAVVVVVALACQFVSCGGFTLSLSLSCAEADAEPAVPFDSEDTPLCSVAATLLRTKPPLGPLLGRGGFLLLFTCLCLAFT